MCKRKPGPRCHSHFRQKLLNAYERHQSASRLLAAKIQGRERGLKITPSMIAEQEASLKRQEDNLYHRIREYYSSPLARKKLVEVELPLAKARMEPLEAEVSQLNQEIKQLETEVNSLKDRASRRRMKRNGNIKEKKRRLHEARTQLAAAQRKLDAAQTDYARKAKNAYYGAKRWEEAKGNLAAQRVVDGNLEAGNYYGALYTPNELNSAAAWEKVPMVSRPDDEDEATKNAPKAKRGKRGLIARKGQFIPKEQRDRGERLIRKVELETPSFEQFKGEIETRVEPFQGGYRVVANPKGEVNYPDEDKTPEGYNSVREYMRGTEAGLSGQPGHEHRPRTQKTFYRKLQKTEQVGEDYREDAVQVTRNPKHPLGIYKTKAEAERAALAWANSDKLAQFASYYVREKAVRDSMTRAGYTTREAQDELLAKQRAALSSEQRLEMSLGH